jgi:nitroreductase
VNVHDAILSRRTIRQFAPKPVSREILAKLVDAGRLAPSAANLQPLEFIVVESEDLRNKVFACLKWAASIAPAGNPRPGQEPRAYVFVLVNTHIREKMYEYDVGAAVENMAIAAQAEGIASCWLISIDRPKIMELLNVPPRCKVDSVLALGYPAQESKVEELTETRKQYWQDPDGTFHVPKRTLAGVIHFEKY